MSRILIVEDEVALARLLTRLLVAAGYEVSVAATAGAGLRQAAELDPDLIILDLMLPDLRGEEVLTRLLSERPDTRVLVLSSVTQIEARVAVLTGGAADFLEKPFANAELIARIEARIRRIAGEPRPAAADPRLLKFRGLYLDTFRQELVIDSRHVKLSQREFAVLSQLVRHAPEPCSRSQLIATVWGDGYDTGTNLVDVYIRRLRDKLRTDNTIETVRNVGYRLVAS